MTATAWITATPPTPNGELHVGHLAGPYVAADVLRRFLRADGEPCRLTSGLDDHDSVVELCALTQGRKTEEVADGYGEAITVDWRRAGVEFDQITHPRAEPGHLAAVRGLFQELHAEGVIVPRSRLLPFCAPCDRPLHGAYVGGGCPSCGAPAQGNLCRSCARPNDCGDLLDPHCVLCGTPAGLRQVRRLYLPLEHFRRELTEYWAGLELPPRLAVLCDRLLQDGLPEVAVSHPGDWGVEVPVAGFTEQRIDPRFELAAGRLRQQEGRDGGPVEFFGFDRAYVHLALVPAVLSARGAALPSAFQVNEHYRLDGRRFSTGARHAVWALDALTEAGSDTLRRHVLSERPEGRPADFDPAALDATREHLQGSWNSWLATLFTALREDCDGLRPEQEPGGAGWAQLRERLERTAGDLRCAYGPLGFSPRRVVALLDEVVRLAEDFHAVNAHERDRPSGAERYRASLSAELAIAAALAAWAWPVMPEGAERLACALGLPAGGPVTAAALTPPAPGTRPAPPSGPVFGY
ncbi:class I tRNA ligase family protein [Kitasatospora sp. NPDC002227]|uniref:class I tRNA ligase family protein n=1 Tax=Kitasatospora sp. NPDC002227 TaxID=3154773 RepID=UPI00332BB48D